MITAEKQVTVDDCTAFAAMLVPYTTEGLSRNEKMIVTLANEVARLRAEVIAARRKDHP